MVIPRIHSVIHNASYGIGQLIVIGKNGPSITITTQIFRRKERGRSHMADGTGFLFFAALKLMVSSYGLCIVLDHKKVVSFRNFHNGIHIGTLSKKMYRNNRFCLWCNRPFHSQRINVKSVRFYVYQYRSKL